MRRKWSEHTCTWGWCWNLYSVYESTARPKTLLLTAVFTIYVFLVHHPSILFSFGQKKNPSSFLSFFFLYYSSNLINYNYFISTQRNKFKSRNTILMNFQLNAIKYRTYSCLSVLFLWNTLLLLCISTFRSLFSE